MPSARDWEQMLKTALEMKAMSQKFIDFAHMYGAGAGGEGEEDLEELSEDDTKDTMPELPPVEDEEEEDEEEEPQKVGKMNKRNPKAALLLAIDIKKKKGKK